MKPSAFSDNALAAALPITTIVVAVVAGVALGVEISLLVIAAGALAGVIALLWASVQSLTGESPITLEEAITLGAPSAEEEQKRAVLRALKDLEFERSVGKISEEDYAELSARYRSEAKRLIQALDTEAEPERERVEKALKERLARSAKAAPKRAEPKPDAEDAEATPEDDGTDSEPEADAAPPDAAAALDAEDRPATKRSADAEGAS